MIYKYIYGRCSCTYVGAIALRTCRLHMELLHEQIAAALPKGVESSLLTVAEYMLLLCNM